MRLLKLVLASLTAGALVALPVASAGAQAPPSYQSSEPAKGAMMDHPPSEVTVTFDQPLDPSSWMNVLDECGKEIDAGPAAVDLTEMTVQIGSRTPSGMYKVVYKAVGLAGATGTSTSSFEFMVHHGSPCKGVKKPPHHHDPKKKDPHDHDDRDRDGHDDHDMGTGPGTDHSGHSGMTTGSPDHSGHTMAPDSGHAGGHDGDHANHRRAAGRDKQPAGNPALAGGIASGPMTADAEAVLVGLGLALAVGVLGGWLLRMSGPQQA